MANQTVYPYGTGGSLPSSIGLVNDFTTGGVDKAQTAESVKTFYEDVFGDSGTRVFTKSDAQIVVTQSGVPASSGTRIRVILPVKTGDVISCSCSLGKGCAASIYDTLEKCYPSSSNYEQTISYTYQSQLNGVSEVEGFLSVSLAKSDDSVFTEQEKSDYIDALVLTVTRYSRTGGIAPSVKMLVDSASFPFIVEGWTARATGIVTKNNSYRSTELIKINALAEYHICGVYGTNVGLCVFYDENLGYVGYYDETGLQSPARVSISKKDGSIPLGAVYMRITGGESSEHYCVQVGGNVEIEESGWNEFPITKLTQNKLSSGNISDVDSTRVCNVCVCSIPYDGVTFKFRLPPFICIFMYSGHGASGTAINFTNNSGWLTDRGEYTVPSGDTYIRFVFAYRQHMPQQTNDDSYDLSVATVEQYVADGRIAILYKDYAPDVVAANIDCEKYARAAMRKFTNNTGSDGNLHTFFVFAHTSDSHGDVVRTKRFLEYSDMLGVDAAVHSGDMVAYRGFDRMYYVNVLADRAESPVFICMGNHDSGKFGDFATAQEQYNSVMKYLIDKNECATNPEEDYPTYYYKDFPAKKIRLISLNSYEEGRKYSTSTNCYYSKKQIDWLIDTLSSTPANYGVLLMYHSPESTIQKDVNRSVFYQDSTPVGYQSDSITGGPIVKIIDAFITKSAISDSFTQTNNSSQTETISYSADFSSLNSGVEFIAHICGHEHCDFIGYYALGSSRQLVLNVTCTIANYDENYLGLAHYSDLPRGGEGVTQDSFNIYAIDRARGIVKVARIGSNTNFDGQDRKFAVMPYKD